MMKEVSDSESPLEFWQLQVPPACSIRKAALRILSGKPSALRCERLWSSAKLVFSENRRSLATSRMMQLLNLKCNASLLDGERVEDALDVLDQLKTDFESIFEDVALAEEEEQAAHKQEPIKRCAEGIDIDSEDALGAEDEDDEPLDLFALDE